MKTLPILGTGLLAVLLVLGPSAAFAATTLTVVPGQSSYSDSNTISISGTVSPTPSVASNVVLTITNPSGAIVDVSSNPVSTTTGTYSYAVVAGGTPSWTAGTYTIKAVWGASGQSASATATFTYTPSSTTAAAVTPYLVVQAQATTPVFAGQTVQLAVLVEWNNGTLACANPCFGTVYVYTPSGTQKTIYDPTNSSTNPITVRTGFFVWSWTVPSSATDGMYAVHAWASVTSGAATYQGQGLTSYTVNSQLASSSQVSAIKSELDTVSSTVQSVSSSVSSLSSSLSTITTGIQGVGKNVTSLSSALTSMNSGLTTAIGNVQSAVTGLGGSITTLSNNVGGLSSSLTTIGNNVNQLMSSVSSLSTSVGSLSGLSSQMNSLSASISTNQTYVLVVAALAAITLVLELAILVRKLS